MNVTIEMPEKLTARIREYIAAYHEQADAEEQGTADPDVWHDLEDEASEIVHAIAELI